jgi:sugar phosphate permease
MAAGFLADRFGAGNMTVVSFLLLIIGSAVLASEILTASMVVPYVITIVCASLGIFALRGLYFAIMEEGQVPLAYTGSAVGLVSVVGYTPDIFMGPLMGYLLDSSPGTDGHHNVFLVIMAFSIAGLIASILFVRITNSKAR